MNIINLKNEKIKTLPNKVDDSFVKIKGKEYSLYIYKGRDYYIDVEEADELSDELLWSKIIKVIGE